MKRSEKQAIDDALVSVGCRIGDDALMLGETSLPGVSAEAMLTSVRSQFPAGYKKMSLNELMIAYKSCKAPSEIIEESHSGRHPGIDDNYSALFAGAGMVYSLLANKWYHKDRIAPMNTSEIRELLSSWRQSEGRSLIQQLEFNPTLDAIISALTNADNVYTDRCRRRIVAAWEYSCELSEMRREWITRFLSELVITENLEEHIVMISHFFWQIKRSLVLKPRYQNIALWISGGQGIGKTYLTQHTIIKLLGEQFTQVIADKQRMDDSWSNAALAATPLVTFSDISKSFNDMGKVKAMIDDGVQSNREMHATSVSKTAQVVNFLFTTNEPLSSVMKDDGMRRWWELPCCRERCNKLDSSWLIEHFQEFMKSIDDDLEHGYNVEDSGYYASILEIQDSNSTTREVEEWISTNLVEDEDGTDLEFLYSQYTDEVKEYHVNKTNFKGALKKLKISITNGKGGRPATVRAVLRSSRNPGFARTVTVTPPAAVPVNDTPFAEFE